MNQQRMALVILIVFVIAYVAFSAFGSKRHGSESPPSSSATPLALNIDTWALTPSFAKAKLEPPPLPEYTIAPGLSLTLSVASSSQQYRLARVELVQGAQLQVSHARADDPSQSGSENVATGQSLTFVLPSVASSVVLTCSGFALCVVAAN
jgi:hypothetical protein